MHSTAFIWPKVVTMFWKQATLERDSACTLAPYPIEKVSRQGATLLTEQQEPARIPKECM
jgi:hypothetical protein